MHYPQRVLERNSGYTARDTVSLEGDVFQFVADTDNGCEGCALHNDARCQLIPRCIGLILQKIEPTEHHALLALKGEL